eukprot:COSAG04_NODE_464_length_13939_cov_11.061922_14_plen_134_part_00
MRLSRRSNGRVWGVPMPPAMRALQQGRGWPPTLLNTLLDQTAWTLVIHVCNFLSIGLLEGHGLGAALAKLRAGMAGAVIAGYKLWPAVQLGVYGFVPERHRLMVVMGFSFFWSIILSSLVNKRPATRADPKLE